MPAALEMLRQMVGINSFTANRQGVDRLGRLTAECFAPLGFTAEFVPSAQRLCFADLLAPAERILPRVLVRPDAEQLHGFG